MDSLPHSVQRWALFAGACLGLAGCAPAAPPAPPPPAVSVSLPLEQEVTDYSTFTGRTAAVESVQVRAHVWGYIDQINFKDGQMVKKGDPLFTIDSRPYDRPRELADAQLKQAEARLSTAKDVVGRDIASPGATPEADKNLHLYALAEAKASRDAAQAAVNMAQLNVDYTKVNAPVSGRVSRAVVTAGNLVQSGDQGGGTLLTTIVSVDPMWVYFDVDDLTFLRVSPMLREAEIHWESDLPVLGASAMGLLGAPVGEGSLLAVSALVPGRTSESGPKVDLGLANEESYPRHGTIDFVDNQVDPSTGTIRMRGVFHNEDAALIPGLFVHVLLPLSGKHKAVLVADRAVDTDQGEKVVYVVGPDNVAEKRSVRLGGLHGGLREILSGVKTGERVVVDGIQWVQAGKPVAPTLVDMPSQTPEGEKGR